MKAKESEKDDPAVKPNLGPRPSVPQNSIVATRLQDILGFIAIPES